MDPAFSSRMQASWFVALLAAIMSLPLMLGKSQLPSRSEIYKSVPWRFGGQPYFQKVIFEEKRPLDIAFIGSSRIWCDIDSKYVRDALSADSGKLAEVRTIGWNTAGFDALYFIAEDLLANRKVKLLVVNDEFNPEIGGNKPHRLASRWYRHSDNSPSLSALPPSAKAAFYSSAVLGAPRNLLTLTRTNLPERPNPTNPFSPSKLYKTADPSSLLGALRVEQNFHDPNGRFLSFTPANGVTAEEAIIWSDATKDQFGRSERRLPEIQLHFAKRLAKLAKQHGATLLFLHLPAIEEVNADRILEAEIWPEMLGGEVRYAGVAPKSLFRNLTGEQIKLLFSDPKHLNRNGQEYFTPLITPSILRIYDEIKDS